MKREFITLLGSTAAAWPLSARAQQPDRVRRIGVILSSESLARTGFMSTRPNDCASLPAALVHRGHRRLLRREGQRVMVANHFL
jgi:hypothetical protein